MWLNRLFDTQKRTRFLFAERRSQVRRELPAAHSEPILGACQEFQRVSRRKVHKRLGKKGWKFLLPSHFAAKISHRLQDRLQPSILVSHEVALQNVNKNRLLA